MEESVLFLENLSESKSTYNWGGLEVLSEWMNTSWLVVICPLYRRKIEYWVWCLTRSYLINEQLYVDRAFDQEQIHLM